VLAERGRRRVDAARRAAQLDRHSELPDAAVDTRLVERDDHFARVDEL
jgi:hypothetical protein